MDSQIKSPVIYRRKISAVWRYFERIGKDKAQCKICNHQQNYQGTTGNILRHLKTKHDIDATVKNHGGLENKTKMNTNSKAASFEEIGVITLENPYVEANKNFIEYINPSREKNDKNGKLSVEEERILAEIEYFREKAAYYRMQKNLVALRAKKIRCELDLMS